MADNQIAGMRLNSLSRPASLTTLNVKIVARTQNSLSSQEEST